MVVIEIPPNTNCDTVDMRVFHDLEPPRVVSQVRLEREPGAPQWYEVIGWSLDGTTMPAQVQKVDDSGEGVALLIYGSSAGLRFRPLGSASPWRLDDPQQWGAPFLLTTEEADVKCVEPKEKS